MKGAYLSYVLIVRLHPVATDDLVATDDVVDNPHAQVTLWLTVLSPQPLMHR